MLQEGWNLKVSVVMCVHNEADDLGRLLENLVDRTVLASMTKLYE